MQSSVSVNYTKILGMDHKLRKPNADPLVLIGLYVRLAQELAELIRSSRTFMSSIAKAKTAKISKYQCLQ